MRKSTRVGKVPAPEGNQTENHIAASGRPNSGPPKWPLCAQTVASLPNGEAIYNQHYQRCLRRVRRRLLRRGFRQGDADPLAAEILDSVLKSTPFDHPQFEKRLARRTRSRSISAWRSPWLARREPIEEGPGELVADPGVDENLLRMVLEVQQVVSRLSPAARTFIRLRFEQGFRLDEIAVLMNKSLSAIKSLSARTLRTLRPKLMHLCPRRALRERR